MSEPLKSIHVRLSPEAYAALSALAKHRGRPRSEVARDLILDFLYGRARECTVETETVNNGGFVYVIRVGDLCKIGKSKNPELRIRGMSLPGKPEVICMRETHDRHATERRLHQRFHEYRRHGEWFQLPAPVIAELREGHSVR